MKRFFLLIAFFGIIVTSFSQRVYFLYIQAENDQPFYLKMKERIYSSASRGYLILSNLHDSSYNFSLGFPGRNVTEQQFLVMMNAKDHGYLLKDFNEKGWGLFDLQNMSVQMAKSNERTAIDRKKEPYKKDESAFTQILAKASDDSTLLEKPDLTQIKKEEKKDVIVNEVSKQPDQKVEEKKSEEKKPGTAVDEKKADIVDEKAGKIDTVSSAAVEIKEKAQPKAEEIKADQHEIYKKSEVIRKSESSTIEGFGVIFIDEYNDGKKDTIRITIPHSKEITESANKEVKEEKKFLEIDTMKQETAVALKEDKTLNQPQTESKGIKKNNCSAIADENDFFKLRKKMAGIPQDDNMINEARKTFKVKCFSTEQIKNLSTLFLSDGGKYKFFDSAYEYVSDIQNFPSLQSELKSEYYVNRFKVMLR